MSVICSFRYCILLQESSWKMCSRWQPTLRKLQQVPVVLRLPYNAKPMRTSVLNQARWPGKKNVVNGAETKYQDIYALNRLWKPFIFTLTVSGVSIAGAAIWQYENIRHQATLSKGFWNKSHQKYGQFRQHIHSIWKNLSPGDKIFIPLCGLNVLVYLAWRVPRWQPIMTKYFTSGLDSKVLCWPMLLSTFSHFSILHLLANMFVLHSFSDKAVSALGREQFLGMYLSAGMFSSLTSYFYKSLIKCPNSSLGASGAVMCVLGYFCMRYPDSRLAIIFLPQFPFDASMGLKSLIAFDSLGCLFRWAFFDHAAHLGGMLFGMFWFNWGHEFIWRKREPLISAWHNFRGPVT